MDGQPKQEYPLFDYLKKNGWGQSDYALAKRLHITPPVISRIRNGKKAISARIILAVYDNTDLSIEQIRELIGKKP